MDIQPLKGSTTVAFILLGLSACTPASFPLKITDVSAKPDPVVGKVVTLEVEIQSSEDEQDVILQIVPPDAVRLIAGALSWHGSLRPRHTGQHNTPLVVSVIGRRREDKGPINKVPPEAVRASFGS